MDGREPAAGCTFDPRGTHKALTRPKSSRSTGEGVAARVASERDGTTFEIVPAGPPADLADPTEGGPAPARMSATSLGIGDEGLAPKTPELSGPVPSTHGPWDGNPAGQSDARAVGLPLEMEAPVGSRPRLEDSLDLAALGPVRTRLKQSGNTKDFDADAIAWRLLRPVAEPFLSRFRRVGEESGSCVLFVLELLRARPPEE